MFVQPYFGPAVLSSHPPQAFAYKLKIGERQLI